MKKRLLALVLAISLISTLIPTIGGVSAQAAEVEVPTFGDDESKIISRESGYELELNGTWLYRALEDSDEVLNTKPYEFDTDLTKLTYMKNPSKPEKNLEGAIDVPSAVNSNSYYYRSNKGLFSTRVKLSDIGKSSFYIDFDGTNWITSVFVNGKFVEGKIGTRMPWNCDITEALDPNKTYQDIDIVIKGVRYAIDPVGSLSQGPEFFPNKQAKLSDFIDLPYDEESETWVDKNEGNLAWVSNIMPSSKGDSHAGNWGITDKVSIVATSNAVKSAYVDDVFVQPNVVDKSTKTVKKTKKVTKTVKNKKGKKVKKTVKQTYKVKENVFTKNKYFTTEVTLVNPTNAEKTVTVVPSVQKVDLKKVDGKLTSEKVYGANETIADLKEQTVTLAAGETKVVKFEKVAWADAELWWPDINYDTAQMYNFKATIKEGNSVSDVYNQQFGFRDVKIDGVHIRVNGVIRNFWNGLGSLGGSTLEEMMANVKANNDRFERFGSDLGLAGILTNFYGFTPNPTEQMDVLDFIGMPVRVSSQIDGMMISHHPYYSAQDAAKYGVKEGINTTLFENFQIQIEDMVKEHRNHPANIVYSLENEFMYITVALGFQSRTQDIEQAVKQYMSGPCVTLDPTRPYMLDGGGAAMDNSDPIFCHHYAEEQGIIKNSEKLVTTKTRSQSLWLYDEKRPYAAGEVAFFSGEFDTHAWIGGSNAGNSQGDALEAYAKYMKTLYNKYRWNSVAITCPWTTSAGTAIAHPALEPLAVIRETYTSSFFANKGVSLKVKVFNDTFSDSKITAKWSLIDPETNQAVQSGTWSDLTIEPGTGVVKTIKIKKISGLTDRKDYTLRLESSQASSKNEAQGVEFAATKAFSEDQILTAFPKVAKVKLKKKVYVYNTSKAVNKYLKSIGIKTIKVKKYLTKKTVVKKKGKPVYIKKKNKKTGKVTKVKKVKIKRTYMNPKNYKKKFLKKKNMIVLVGAKGTHDISGEGDQAALTLYARAGGRVIYLEQTSEEMLYSEGDTNKSVPIKVYQYTDNSGTYSANYAFGQGFDRPMLNGLKDKDLSMWNGSGKTTAEVWGVPTGSAKSWINVGSKMSGVALLEIPTDKGVTIATQMRVGAKINKEPVAQIMLKNMLTYAETYEVPSSKVGVPASTQAYLKVKLKSTGASIVELPDVVSGLSTTKTKIMIIEATKDNLKALNDNKTTVDNYVADGGWIIFTNLTDDAEALAEYNKLLGTKHVVRPFRLESTTAYSDWTTIGLSTSDYKLYSKHIIAPYSNLSDISQNTWSYGIDATNNMTPFFDFEARGKGNKIDVIEVEKKQGDRRYDAANICNALSSDEHWFYQAGAWIDNKDLPTVEKPLSFDDAYGVSSNDGEFFTFTYEEKLDSITYRQATSGQVIFSGMNVIVDGKKVVDNQSLLRDGSEQTIPLNGVNAKSMDIQFTGYYKDVYKDSFSMAGIEKLYINRQTPQWIIDSNCKALNSSGTLVKYERGEGGFMLNNVRLDTDTAAYREVELSTSIIKKVGIFTKILTNLGAQFE